MSTDRKEFIDNLKKLLDRSIPSKGIDAALRKTIEMLSADEAKAATHVEVQRGDLLMYASLMSEASLTLQGLTPAMVEEAKLRQPLPDELDGAVYMIVDYLDPASDPQAQTAIKAEVADQIEAKTEAAAAKTINYPRRG